MNLTEPQIKQVLAYLADETGLGERPLSNTVELLREGATVPFIARYRKERTGRST